MLSVLVDPSGKVVDVKITRSSGFARLDKAAAGAARRGNYRTGAWVIFSGRVDFKVP